LESSSSEEEVVDEENTTEGEQEEEREAPQTNEAQPKPHPMPYVEVPPLRVRPIAARDPVIEPRIESEPKATKKHQTRSKPEDRELALTVLREIFDKPHPISLSALLRLSPKTRALANELIRAKRLKLNRDHTVPLQEAVITMLEETNRDLGLGDEVIDSDLLDIFEAVSRLGVDEVTVEVLLQDLELPEYFISPGDNEVPAGALVCPDPIEQFLITNSGAEVKGMTAAATSDRIRVFYPVVNLAREEESILDNGSQVCSASEEAAKALGISWDPNFRIGLQSSNRSTATTLGLARNVPIYCGNDVVAYVQLHIVSDAAYKILLGRPFLSAMSAISVNSPDGSEVLTLTDPNNQKSISIPTYPRGVVPEKLKHIVDIPFRTSRS